MRPVANVIYYYTQFRGIFNHVNMFNLYLWIFAEICGLLNLVTTF